MFISVHYVFNGFRGCNVSWVYHCLWWFLMAYRSLPLFIVVYHGFQWLNMFCVYHSSLCLFMVFNGFNVSWHVFLWLLHLRPQTVGGFKKCFKEQGQTHAHMWKGNGGQWTQWEGKGDKTSGRRTRHPAQAHIWEDNGKYLETREDKTFGKAGTPSNKRKHEGAKGHRGENTRKRRQKK